MAAPHPINTMLVDADLNSSLALQKLLEESNYTVTKCQDSEQCLSMIRESPRKFDLVIIEVSVAPIDGYELCKLVREDTNISVILMSSTFSNAEAAKKAGACDFLVKPIKAEDLRKHLAKQELSSGEKEQQICDEPARKKQRFIWTDELHDKFLKAISEIGDDKAVPKKIMEHMNVPEITRENIASHLQKQRQRKRMLQGDSQEKKPRKRRQEQQYCKPNVVKPNEDAIQKPLSVPASSIPHESETVHQVQSFNLDSHQGSLDSMVQQPAGFQEPLDYNVHHSYPRVNFKEQQEELLQQHLALYQEEEEEEQQNPNFLLQLPANLAYTVDDQTVFLPREIELLGVYSNGISGLPVAPKVELSYMGMRPYTEEENISREVDCWLEPDPLPPIPPLPPLLPPPPPPISINPTMETLTWCDLLAFGGDDQGGELAYQNDPVLNLQNNPADGGASQLKDFPPSWS